MGNECPCGSGKQYVQCCEPYILGNLHPATTEELMRSRYSAYAKAQVAYIMETTHPDKRKECDEKAIRSWSENSTWEALEIISSSGGPIDTEGTVEFIAFYTENRTKKNLHEYATFKKVDNRWYYYDGEMRGSRPFKREEAKVSRNDPCPCGSGKKFKKCCGVAA